MSQFRFAQLYWIHAAWLVLGVAVVLVLLELRGRSVLDRMLSRVMQTRLVTRSTLPRRLAAILLVTISLFSLVVAMMRPQWGVTVQALTRVDAQIMVCLDVSKSMLAEDVAPNRLDRAKAELESLLSLMGDGQQVGLIAFAGRATVLCPMTTDFGFLRLVLNDVGPSSVGLGGTKIGEALRKAVDGFGQAGDVNRLILLITDGEDHDSFPVDVAKSARERGIRIVSIGFGDEAGSKIEITDPATGARSFIQDRDGNDVISRLDGETLRDIALETEGAYVPAGTGALDLESIYDKHIASILSGSTTDQERVHRNEAYQWCVLGALVFLVLGLLTASPWSLKTQAIARSQDLMAGRAAAAATLGICLLSAGASRDCVAQQPRQATDLATVEGIDERGSDVDEDDPRETDVSPRELYNQALAYVRGDPDRAERILNQVRREAGVDGEVRFRALYNLGWVEVNRAEAVLEDDPKSAIGHLEQAANRFREAIRVRPENVDARHNLEIISRRILELTDALTKQEQGDLASRLDELIRQQRAGQSELATLVQQVAAEGGTPHTDDRRRDFRRLGISQRQVISDTQKFSDDARRELDSLAQKKDDELSAEERLRTSQLQGMLRFVESSLQRMQKARGLTRRSQGNRAFARWSAALTDAKRARDQLRNPIEILGVLIDDATQLANLTRSLGQATMLPEAGEAAAAPAWLTNEYISELQQAMTQRTSELAEILAAAMEGHQAKQEANESTESDDERRAQELIEGIGQAIPFLQRAAQEFEKAGAELEAERYDVGFQHQSEAILALLDAAEFFFDVRRLIEKIYGQQQELREILSSDLEPKRVADLTTSLLEALEKNRGRCARLDAMFSSELAKLSTDTPPPTAPHSQPPSDTQDPERQRYEIAKQILGAVVEDMEQLKESLGTLASADWTASPEKTPPLATADSVTDVQDQAASSPAEAAEPVEEPQDPRLLTAITHTDASLEKIEELRRLFFSLVEHLRDTGQRQADLNDDTQGLAGQPDGQAAERIEPLAHRQQQLQQITQQIGQALIQQAQQATQPSPEGTDAAGAAPDDTQQRFQQAGELVDEAQVAMGTGGELLKTLVQRDEESKDFGPVSQQQQTALEKIAEALALLDDSPPQHQNQGQDQQQQQQQEQQRDQQRQQEQQQQNLDANQLLQLIRDREAQRRKDRQRAIQAAASAVDKDW